MNDCIKNMLFCTDLMYYVMDRYRLAFDLNEEFEGHIGESPFNTTIGEAVLKTAFEERNKAEEYINSKETKPSKKEVGCYAMSQWCEYLESSFSPDRFISYCGLVCSLSSSYIDKYNDPEICGVLVNALCSRLDGFVCFGILEDNEVWWNDMTSTADEIAESSLRKFKPKKEKEQIHVAN